MSLLNFLINVLSGGLIACGVVGLYIVSPPLAYVFVGIMFLSKALESARQVYIMHVLSQTLKDIEKQQQQKAKLELLKGNSEEEK